MRRLRPAVLACLLVLASSTTGIALTRTACLSRHNTVSFYDQTGSYVADVSVAHRWTFPDRCKRVAGWGTLHRLDYYRQKVVEDR